MPKVEVMTKQDIRNLEVVGADLEVLDWMLYDTLNILTGGTQSTFRFFQQAFGNAGVTKEITNMEIPGQLPSSHKFVAQKLILQPVPNALDYTLPPAQDQLAVTHRGWASFNIGRASYLECPNQCLLGGAFTGFGSGAAAAASLYAAPRTVVNGELEYSPVIPATFSFSVVLEYPAAPTLVANQLLRLIMVGKLVRPRQG
jgi:hypothetical protein